MKEILLALLMLLWLPLYSQTVKGTKPVKYVQQINQYLPKVQTDNELVTYFDYDEALAASKILKKPVLVYFTGINVVNCRKMESNVWSKAEVMNRLKKDFVVASLYCDLDRVQLTKKQQHYSAALKKKVITVADRVEELQEVKYKSNTQPSYYVVDETGKTLSGWLGYEPDAKKFVEYLDIGKAKYKKTHP